MATGAISLRVLACALLAAAVVAVPAAPTAVDPVHRHMEPPPPKPRTPRLQHPIASRRRRVGGPLAVITRHRMALLPAVAVGAWVAAPTSISWLLMHLICFLGSLIEPFDHVLPKSGILRGMVRLVQQARTAYEVKHGLVPLHEQKRFFDDEDEDDAPGDAAEADGEPDRDTGGADDGNDPNDQDDAVD